MFETNHGRWINDTLKEEVELLKLLSTFDYNNLTMKQLHKAKMYQALKERDG